MSDTATLGSFYDDAFYDGQVETSLGGARAYVEELGKFYAPKSVIDFGCGRGAWLKAFGEAGATRLVGLDGPWNSQSRMIDEKIEFRPVQMNMFLRGPWEGERFDLSMSLEVYEHLEPESSEPGVHTLCAAADVVMFGAAFLHQSGTNHINLRRHSFWAGLFRDEGYEVFDVFRPALWGRSEVPYWYQQNTYLYVKRGHPLSATLAEHGFAPVQRLDLLDCVHPDLLDWHVNKSPSRRLREAVRDLLPASIRNASKKPRAL